MMLLTIAFSAKPLKSKLPVSSRFLRDAIPISRYETLVLRDVTHTSQLGANFFKETDKFLVTPVGKWKFAL